jgi:hypothetical protein
VTTKKSVQWEYKIDLEKVALRKIALNAQKYPIEKSKGSDKKYNEK